MVTSTEFSVSKTFKKATRTRRWIHVIAVEFHIWLHIRRQRLFVKLQVHSVLSIRSLCPLFDQLHGKKGFCIDRRAPTSVIGFYELRRNLARNGVQQPLLRKSLKKFKILDAVIQPLGLVKLSPEAPSGILSIYITLDVFCQGRILGIVRGTHRGLIDPRVLRPF